jgi:hypothetical protein
MRSISTSDIVYTTAGEVTGAGSQTREVQAADPVIMQAGVAAVLAELSGANWVLTHIDLAGGGDGHTFVCTMEFADTVAVAGSTGLVVDPLTLGIFFYMAAQSEALVAARNAVRPAIAALFSPPISATQVDIVQTLVAGASKGTRFMGGLVCQIEVIT